MMLTGLSIKEMINSENPNIKIVPYNEDQLNPNSYDLRLHNELLVYSHFNLDMKRDNETKKIIIPETGLMLKPGQLYLGRTVEWTETNGLVAGLDGKSSVGRLGINVHATAGFGDIGFKGYWTLEISCIKPVRIYPNVRICQIYYHTIYGDYDNYNGKYQNNDNVEASKMYKDFEK